MPSRPSGNACFLCPYVPYNGLPHRKQRVRMARMLRGISPGGFVPLTTVGTICCQPSRNMRARGGYLRAADISSFCTLADGVVVQMICCTNNGRFLYLKKFQQVVSIVHG